MQRKFDPPGTVQAFDSRTVEVLNPTQIFPTKATRFGRQGVSLEDANDLTPEIHATAVARMQRSQLGPLFRTSLRGMLQRPGSSGGANWSGAVSDPETELLYVRTSEDADTKQVCANAGGDLRVDVANSNNCPYDATLVMFREAGGPGAAQAPESEFDPIPLTKPPYAQLVAIDLNAGVIAWKAPFGKGSEEIRQHPLLCDVKLPERLGTNDNSGPLVIKGGLVLLGGAAPYVYVFDTATGTEIWPSATPFRTAASPMFYQTGSGQQFVFIATSVRPNAAPVAFTLSRQFDSATIFGGVERAHRMVIVKNRTEI